MLIGAFPLITKPPQLPAPADASLALKGPVKTIGALAVPSANIFDPR